MTQWYSFVLLSLVAALSLTPRFTESRLQFALPRDNIQESTKEDTFLHRPHTTEEDEETQKLDTTYQLRATLNALLHLNDGELNALLKGVPVESMKSRVSPSTALFLKAERRHFERLKTLLGDQALSSHPGDLRIARRNKKPNSQYSSDSLLGALLELSDTIDEGTSQKRKRHISHHASQNIHYSYWLKPEECPDSAQGFPQVHCPSPTKGGDWVCVEEVDLCDGHSHCPKHEDEQPLACLFFKTMQNHLDLLVSALLVSRRS